MTSTTRPLLRALDHRSNRLDDSGPLALLEDHAGTHLFGVGLVALTIHPMLGVPMPHNHEGTTYTGSPAKADANHNDGGQR